MKPLHFAGLVAAAGLSLFAAISVYVSSRPWTTAGVEVDEVMLPALRDASGKIAAIEIAKGDDKIRLAARNGEWLIESGENYPADAQAVRKLVIAASEAKLIERKTAKKELHQALGLADPGSGGTVGRHIRFLDDAGSVIAEIIAGNARNESIQASGTGTYVRRPGEEQTWLANRQISATTSFRDWTKTKLIDWSTESIKSADIEFKAESAYRIDRDADGKTHKLATMPPGKKLKFVNSVDDIIEAASLIEFKNVRKAGKGTALPKAGRVILAADSGVKITVDYYSDDKEAWVTMMPEGEGEEGKKIADEIKGRTEGWEFEVPVGEVTATLKKYTDLLEDAPS